MPSPRAYRGRATAGATALGLGFILVLAACVGSGTLAGSSSTQPSAGPPDSPSTYAEVSSGAPAADPTASLYTVSLSLDVPPDIADRPWAINTPTGFASGPSLLTNPSIVSGERLLDWSDGLAVTISPTDSGSTLRLRQAGTGNPLLAVVSDHQWASAQRTKNFIYVSGWDGSAPTYATGIDSISNGTGEVREVEPATDLPKVFAGDAYRALRVSLSGHTIASQLCASNGECVIELLRDEKPLGHVLHNAGFLVLCTDNVVVTLSSDGATLSAFDAPTGKLAWSLGDAEFQEVYLTGKGTLIQSYIDHASNFQYTIAALDPTTGTRKVLWTAPADRNRYLLSALSTDRYALISDENPALSSHLALDIVDLTAGSASPKAITFGWK